MRKNLFKLLMTFLLIAGSYFIANAQVNLYDFTQSNSTYTELTGATTLATATAVTGTGSLDDINYTLASGTIPFSFVYDGVSYTGCTVSTNGYITFGTTAPTTTSYTPISATTAYAGAVSALGGNLNAYFITGNAAQTGSISYQTLGTTPNRKFVIQFKNFKPLAQSGTTYTTAMNFQIALNETSNAIDVIYNFTTGTYTAGSYQVGLRGANNTYPTNIKNRAVVTGTNTWATSTVGSANTSTCGISSTLLPAQGLTFRYAPTSCPSPTDLSATQITTNSATLSWTNPVTGGTFTVEYGPVGFTPGTGTIVSTSTNSTSISGLSALTSYSFYVQKSCGAGSNSLKVGPFNFSTGGVGEDCSTAQLLSVASSLATCSYTTVSTGVSINGPTSFCSDINGNQATNDKWFKFVAPANGKKLVLTTQAGTNNDWVMEVWTGCPGGTGYQVKCGDDQNGAMPEISMCQNEYVAGQTYYVRVWTYIPFSTGTMNICIYETTMCAVAPSNDNCANAIRLSVNPPLTCATNSRTFLNNYATRNTDAATCDASLLKGDVWFVFNTGNFSDVDLTINAITAVNVKAQLLFECGGFEVACWNPGTGTKTITGLNPQADYILRVWTDSTTAGTFSICITDRCSNPTATTSGSYTTCTGNTVSIPVTFTGTPPFALTYLNGTTSASVTGITTTNYNLIVTPAATSTYVLTAMNDATCVGSASGSASVTVITPQNVTLNAFSPICDNAPPQLLSGGSPSGGVYSGVGVSNGYFNPAFGTQTITYTVTYTAGCSRSSSEIYTVNPLPTVSLGSFNSVCNTSAAFALTGGSPTGGSYVGTGVSNNTFNPATAGPGTYVITYYYTTAAGCTANDTSTIVVTNCSVCTNAPTANAGVDKIICYNSSATITGSIGGSASSQIWSGGTGTYSPNNSSLNITYTPSAAEIAAGSARLVLITNDPDGNGPCVAASDTVNLTITPAPQVGSISGSTSVCKNQTGVTYSVIAQAGLTYTWTVPTGVTITAGQGTNSITTTWGSTAVTGNIGISITNTCGTSIGSLAVSVSSAPTTPTIIGSPSVCLNQTGVVYSMTAQIGVTYTWTVPTGVTITAGQGTNSITTTWGASAVSGNVGITVTNSCGSSTGSSIVTVGSGPTTPTVSGSSSVCRNQTGVVYSVVAQTGSSYTWTVPTGATITAGQSTNSITVTWGASSVTGNVGITVTNSCGSSTGSLAVTVGSAPTTPTITGSTSLCLNQTGVVYSVTAQTGVTYTWTVPTGVTITAGQGTNSITTTWGASAVSGNVGITVTNSCGSSTGSSTVTVGAGATTPTINGSSSVCLNQTGVVYSITAQTGATYTWTVPTGVTITAGQGTNSITTTWSASAVSGNVGITVTNSCGNSSANFAVTVGSGTSSPTISGLTSVCRNQSGVIYSVGTQTGATYTWTVPTGATITTGQSSNSITVTWGSTAVAGNIGISITNTCGTSTGSLAVTVGSAPSTPTVSGSTSVCLNQTGVVYSVTAQTGVTYTWTVPTGVTITAGQGTNSITTTIGTSAVAGNIAVAISNSCGTSNGQLALAITPATSLSSISGSTSICLPQSQLIYSVTSQVGVTYTWTVPTGVTILSGQGTNQITTSWTTAAVSGNISVVATGTCNNASSSLPVTISSGTLSVGAITGNTGVCASTTGNIYSVVNQSGTTYTWTLPTGGTITAGQGTNSVTVSWSATVVAGSIKVVGVKACATDSTTITTILRTTAPTQPSVITGNATMCSIDSAYYTITKSANADFYTWVPDTGMTINGSSVSITIPDTIVKVVFTSAFTGDTIKVRAGNCKGVGAYRVLKVNKRTTTPSAITAITGQATGLCGVTTATYTIASASGATNYTWRTNITGALINGQAVTSLTVDGSVLSVTITYPTAWVGSGNIYVKANNGCGSSAETGLAVSSVVPTPGTITGSTSVCPNQTGVVYSIVAQAGITYNWTVPSGVTLTAGQGTNSITTTWSSTAVAGNVAVAITSACGTSSNSLAVSLASGNLSVGPITGNSSNCKNTTGIVYSVPAIAGATYTWTVPTGVTITAGQGTNSITTSWTSTAVAGNVSITANTTCSSGNAVLPVTINTGIVVGAISGSSPICRPATGVVYSVAAQTGVTYVWTVPTGVTITAGAGTNSITTTWSSTSVTSDIKVVGTSACGKDSTIRNITVRTAVPTQPSTVTGATTACIGDALKFSITKVATADYYVWTPKTGMLVNGSATALTTTDTAVTVTFTTGFVGDTLKVNGGNCKGLSTVRTKVITRNTAAPTTPGTVTGQTTGICGGGTYTYSFATAVTNATSYTWRTKTAGALLNGQAVSSLTVSAPTQSITVTYPTTTTTFDSLFVKSNNGCGSSAERGLKVNVIPATPGAITTPAVLCIGTTVPQVFSVAAVTGATSYTWTYPTTGTTYVSGQGTTSLTLRFTATGAKAITVKSTNACGSSATSASSSVSPTAACPVARDGSAYDLSGIAVYPNPTRGNVTIAYTSADNSDYLLTIFDMSGRTIDTYTLYALEGYNQKELNLETLVKGTYFVSLKGNGLVTQTRLIIE